MEKLFQPQKVAMFVMLIATVGCFVSGCKVEKQNPINSPRFAELSQEDAGRLDKQRKLIEATAKERYGTSSLPGTKDALPILQRLIDDQVFKKSQTYELQCLGVAFGDVLANEYPLRWVMITDEYGTDPTLRYKELPLQINALTMISKRVEQGEPVDLSRLLRITGEQLDHFEKEWQK